MGIHSCLFHSEASVKLSTRALNVIAIEPVSELILARVQIQVETRFVFSLPVRSFERIRSFPVETQDNYSLNSASMSRVEILTLFPTKTYHDSRPASKINKTT